MPPANQIVRALWPRITHGPDRRAVYAAEATLQELVFVFGPMLAAGAVALAGARVALMVVAATALLGSLGFVAALRRAELTRPPAVRGAGGSSDPEPRRSLLRSPALPLLFGMMLLMTGGVVAMDLGIVAWANELAAPEYVVVLAAIWALGSLVGGLVAGLGMGLLVALLPPVLELPSPWLITPVLFASGLAIAPTLAAALGRLSDLAPPERRAEAFGWLATAMTTGSALAAPFVGALIDMGGIAAGFGGAAALVLVAAVLALFLPVPAEARTTTDPDLAPR